MFTQPAQYLRIILNGLLKTVLDLITKSSWFLRSYSSQVLPLGVVHITQVVQCSSLANLATPDEDTHAQIGNEKIKQANDRTNSTVHHNSSATHIKLQIVKTLSSAEQSTVIILSPLLRFNDLRSQHIRHLCTSNFSGRDR